MFAPKHKLISKPTAKQINGVCGKRRCYYIECHMQTGAVIAISLKASFADAFHLFAITSAEVNRRTVCVVVTAAVVLVTRVYLCNNDYILLIEPSIE